MFNKMFSNKNEKLHAMTAKYIPTAKHGSTQFYPHLV